MRVPWKIASSESDSVLVIVDALSFFRSGERLPCPTCMLDTDCNMHLCNTLHRNGSENLLDLFRAVPRSKNKHAGYWVLPEITTIALRFVYVLANESRTRLDGASLVSEICRGSQGPLQICTCSATFVGQPVVRVTKQKRRTCTA